jgi:hypothetical protein
MTGQAGPGKIRDDLDEHVAEVLKQFEGMDLDIDMVAAIRGLVREIWTFEWLGRSDAEIDVELVDGLPKLSLRVWVNSTDDPEGDKEESYGPLGVFTDVERYVEPRQQIRSIVHWHLCHEVDELLSFGGEQPFYPKHTPHPTRPGVSLID